MKQMTYGDAQAILVLAADKMGLEPGHVEDAKRQLDGVNIHPMISCAISKEAVSANNRLRHDASLIAKANTFAEEIRVQYGFAAASAN